VINKKLNLTKDILLRVAAAGGFMIIALAAPGAIRILGPFAKKYLKDTLYPSRMKKKFKSLKDQGLVTIGEQDGKTKIILTKAGKERILEYEVDDMQIKKQTPWDKKWRYVFFDIPEKKRNARNVFRFKLRELGFRKIQQSVWRHKYPCRREIEFLTNLYEINRYVDMVEGRIVI